jgi:organic radical activating enzyme
MYLSVDYLIFEITRDCNQECDHCLRGKKQKVNMTRSIVNKTLKDVKQISQVTFTGGEPMLNIPLMKYIFNRIHKQEIDLNSWWIATNGTIYNQKFMNVLVEEYINCLDNNCGDFYGALTVSIDNYHNKVPKENLMKFKAYKFYSDEKERKDNKHDWIISDGLARINGLGEKRIEIDKELHYEITDDEIIIEDDLYINALGDVLVKCNYSYARQKRATIGNVLKTPLIEIIKQKIKEQDPEIEFQESSFMEAIHV